MDDLKPLSLTFSAQFATAEPVDNSPRKFSGVAYSGGLVPDYWGGDFAVDLSGITIPDSNIPVLDSHENAISAVVGRGRVRVENNMLMIEGELADTDAARQVATIADSGVPLQLSMGIYQTKIEDFGKKGREVTINGRDMSLNAVLRSGALREVSFTPLGADPNTSVSVFNAINEGQTVELAELETKISELEAENEKLAEMLKEANAKADEIEVELAAERMDRRENDVRSLFAAIGREYSDESASVYLEMSAEHFSAVSKDLRETAPAIDPALTVEAAKGETLSAGSKGFNLPVGVGLSVDQDSIELHNRALAHMAKNPGVDYLSAVSAVAN